LAVPLDGGVSSATQNLKEPNFSMKVYGLLELITIFYREKFWTKIANKNFLE
jgi:hypothetical protein